MRVAILGGDGRTGRLVIEESLNRGHEVNAGVFRIPKLRNLGVNYIKCNALHHDDVKRLLTNCDVVVSVIGHVKGSQPDTQTVAITNVTKVMSELKINRLISLTGTGVRSDKDKVTLIDRFLNLAVRLVDPDRVKDGIEHAEVVRESNLNWTIVRVLKLTNGKLQDHRLTENGPAMSFVSRYTVARSIIELLESDKYSQKMPIISSL